jgi:hypothetical protein
MARLPLVHSTPRSCGSFQPLRCERWIVSPGWGGWHAALRLASRVAFLRPPAATPHPCFRDPPSFRGTGNKRCLVSVTAFSGVPSASASANVTYLVRVFLRSGWACRPVRQQQRLPWRRAAAFPRTVCSPATHAAPTSRACTPTPRRAQAPPIARLVGAPYQAGPAYPAAVALDASNSSCASPPCNYTVRLTRAEGAGQGSCRCKQGFAWLARPEGARGDPHRPRSRSRSRSRSRPCPTQWTVACAGGVGATLSGQVALVTAGNTPGATINPFQPLGFITK